MTTEEVKFATHGVLSAATGRLMGDIGDLYAVISHLIGRPAYTHELGFYGDCAAAVLRQHHPDLPASATQENWQQVKADAIARFGETMTLAPELAGVLADNENAVSTLFKMIDGAKAP